MGLRERKKDKTRRRIVDAAFDLFRRYGFGPVTMDQVAEAAEVSRSTLFRYFGTKEALVFPYQAERLQRFSRLLARPVAGESAYETMERALVKMAEEFQDAADEIAAQQRIISDSPQLQARERALYDEWE
ncbi:MAG: TetR family transcriptional regulator, partial [Deltaproteobacteria bacterium]